MKETKEMLLEDLAEFSKGMEGSSTYNPKVVIKLMLKALELKERGLKSKEIGVN